MCPLVEADFSSKVFEISWTRCIFVLRYHLEEMPSSEKAIFFLESLKAKMCQISTRDNVDAGKDGTQKL
jgi:hypothetical protein